MLRRGEHRLEIAATTGDGRISGAIPLLAWVARDLEDLRHL
jgi:hypothetical protein